jgi:type IV pilus assembly protein PilB
MFDRRSESLHDCLREYELVAPAQLDAITDDARNEGRPLAELLVERGLFEREALFEKVAQCVGLPFAGPAEAAISADALALVPAELARRWRVMPLRVDDECLDLLSADPFDTEAGEALAFALGRDVRLLLAAPDTIEACFQRHYPRPHEQTTAAAPVHLISDDPADATRAIEAMAGQAPIVRLVDLVLEEAIREKASDIHFEPFEHEFKIRYRVDGSLFEMTPPPRHLALPISSRLKVLANLDIAERRLPQDGRIPWKRAGVAVDLRVSTLPTHFGESVVVRILDRSAVQLDLAELGMPPQVQRGVEGAIRRPNGIFLVTGPTGSGKTTTLYSCLRAINGVGSKVLTAEDPVEYEIDGVMQLPVNPAAGLTFASAMRSFLRQDPDVILVGEIRDRETAQIAIQAALTGHLVFSTLHTNDAAGAVTRLIDLGVEPFLIASSLGGVLAQRLVRRICPDCRADLEVDRPSMPVDGDALNGRPTTFFRGVGCPRCKHTGYVGRLGIFEWLGVSDEIRQLIEQRASTLEIRESALRGGMRTLRQDGLVAAADGRTTLDEVLRCT